MRNNVIMSATAAVALWNPKYPRNVGTAVRALSCYGYDNLYVSGTRVPLERSSNKGYRLPREERMRGGNAIHVERVDRFFDHRPDLTPVAVELIPGAELLPHFEHPERALYVFGPEDGSLPAGVLASCHRFVQIPMRHCANLASAVYTVLYDRHMKDVLRGVNPLELEQSPWAEESQEMMA